MGTLIQKHIWAGGEGADDRYKTIGYCVESPYEVLYNTVFDYVIHSYKQSYCNIIDEYPSNVEGLVIREYNDNKPYGFKIVGLLNDILEMDEIKKLKWDKFDEKKLVKRINELDKYAEHFDDSNTYKEKYRDIVRDLKQLYFEFQTNRFG